MTRPLLPPTLRGYLRSPFDRDIARLAVPALGTLVAEPLYVLADTAIVGRLGTTQLAGLALATAVLLIVHALSIFLAYGTTGPVARLIGAGQEGRAATRSVQGLWLALVLGLFATVVLILLADPLLRAFGGEGDVLVAANRYLTVSLAGVPFMLILLAANGAFHGRQDTRTPLALALTGAVFNLVLEVILIFGFDLGIGASAAATVVAQALTGTAAVVLIVRWARSQGADLMPRRDDILALLKSGQALVLRTAALRASFALSVAIATRLGPSEIAAHQIGLQVWGLAALALDAVAIAGQSITGTFLGTYDLDGARAAARRMIQIDVAVGVVVGLVLLVARTPLIGVFTLDDAVRTAGALVLFHVAIQQPLGGFVFALDGILIGASDFRYLAVSMIGAAVGFGVLAGLVAMTGAGLGWLWAAIAGFMVFRAVFLWFRWRTGAWLVPGTG